MRLLLFLLSTMLCINLLSAEVISWDTKEIKLQLEPTQSDIRATFTLTNNSEFPIRLDRVETSCGCTASIIKSKVVEPGEKGEVIGIFHKGKRSGVSRNTLNLFIEGVDHSVATLSMVVEIPELIRIQPKIIYWKSGEAETPKKVKISYDPKYIDTLGELKYDETKLSVKRVINSNKPNETEFTVLPKTFGASLRDMLRVTATGPEGLSVEENAHVFVQP